MRKSHQKIMVDDFWVTPRTISNHALTIALMPCFPMSGDAAIKELRTWVVEQQLLDSVVSKITFAHFVFPGVLFEAKGETQLTTVDY